MCSRVDQDHVLEWTMCFRVDQAMCYLVRVDQDHVLPSESGPCVLEWTMCSLVSESGPCVP